MAERPLFYNAENRPDLAGLPTIFVDQNVSRPEAVVHCTAEILKYGFTAGRFSNLRANRYACFQAAHYAGNIAKVFYPRMPVHVAVAQFDRKIQTPEFGAHTGQMVLAMDLLEDGKTITVIDPAAYIFGCDYEQIPVASGDPLYVAAILKELYSQSLGVDLSVELTGKGIPQ
jgi:hypothetical protein